MTSIAARTSQPFVEGGNHGSIGITHSAIYRIVTPIVRQLPRESLEKTLLNTRRALSAR